MKPSTALLATLLLAMPAWSQAPADASAGPPANAQHFLVLSLTGPHGESWRWTTPSGEIRARETLTLDGEVTELEARATAGADGLPVRIEISGRTPRGDAAEDFSASDGHATWKSPVDSGSADAAGAAGHFYASVNAPVGLLGWLAERTLAAPGQALALLPHGAVTATKLRTVELHGVYPEDKRSVDVWVFTGLGNSPQPVWMNGDGTFFGIAGALSWLPDTYSAEEKTLEDAQTGALSLAAGRLSQKLAHPRRGGTAFTHVRLYDAEKRTFLNNQTVIVEGASISNVGPTREVPLPPGVLLFDGTGKTLLPGLWDMHMHVADDYTGFQELALGVTSIRDTGNDDERTIDRRQRVDAEELLMPNVYALGAIDGEGPYTMPFANIATSQEWTNAYVDQAFENDFIGASFYRSLNPDWVAAAAAEAHRIGLHVHGVPPARMRPLDALGAGFDELSQLGSLLLQAAPEPVLARAGGPEFSFDLARLAKEVDIDGPEVTALLRSMIQKKTFLDPTLVAYESLFVPETGQLAPAHAPYAGTMSPVAERSLRAGGLALPAGSTRAELRASFTRLVALLERVRRAGIPIVAGSAGNGLELVRELELYVQAGYTPAEALATATILPATLVGQQSVTGSIGIGKDADLFLVDGDPSKDIGALRRTSMVMVGGRLMEADGLRRAAGYSDRPH
jgi:hypothetical protein